MIGVLSHMWLTKWIKQFKKKKKKKLIYMCMYAWLHCWSSVSSGAHIPATLLCVVVPSSDSLSELSCLRAAMRLSFIFLWKNKNRYEERPQGFYSVDCRTITLVQKKINCFLSNTLWRSALCSIGWLLCRRWLHTLRPGLEPAEPPPELGPRRY